MTTEIDVTDEDKLNLLFTLDEAAHLVFSETPEFAIVCWSRAHMAAQTLESLLVRKVRDLIDQREVLMNARDGYERGTPEWEELEDSVQQISQHMEALVNGEEVGTDYAYPPYGELMVQTAHEQNGLIRLVRLRDFIKWCLDQGYPVQDQYADLVEIATRGAPTDVDFLVNSEAWELPQAVRAVFGDIGSHWQDDRLIVGLYVSDFSAEPDYTDHLAHCEELGLQPLDATDFLLSKTLEYLMAMRAIRTGEITTFPDDSHVFPVVESKSFLSWVRSKGFTIPRKLRVLLDAESHQEIVRSDLRKDNEGSLNEFEHCNTLEDTTAKFWTTLSGKGAFHLSTATGGINDGRADFEFGKKNTQLISLLCKRWPEPVQLGEIINEAYNEEQELSLPPSFDR